MCDVNSLIGGTLMPLPEFKNEPLSDFKNNPAHRRRMQYALDEIREELGREYDIVIGGERVKTPTKLYSYNPSHPQQVVGIFSQADAALAERASSLLLKRADQYGVAVKQGGIPIPS